MHVDEIRKVAKVRPFRPFEMRVDTGEKYVDGRSAKAL